MKKILDAYVLDKNTDIGLFSHADPLWIARQNPEPHKALICALFAYGNANLIVKFLKSLDFSLLDKDDAYIQKSLNSHKYRFQNTRDVCEIFKSIKRLKNECKIEEILLNGYKNGGMIYAINSLICKIYSLNSYHSDGYDFFFGKEFENTAKSPYKRYNMYLRWMVRDSDIDLGLFKKLPKSQLLLPLDVHTHRVSQALKLCSRKSYDFKAVVEITENLRKFDPQDPIKYDFALYRIGQSGELDKVLAKI
ncbi:MAG: TIGR02757 family protein [Campylobacter sp.]|nr:TIGR02757 family protein [Campylobacter sp.]